MPSSAPSPSPSPSFTSDGSAAGSTGGWPSEGKQGVVERLRGIARLAVDDELLGARWFYHEAGRFCSWLAGVSGIDQDAACGVVAALSPRNHWDANQLDAIALCQGGEPRNGSSFGAMPRDQGIAQRILDGDPTDEAIRGPKVRAFYRCLRWPEEDRSLPIDRHLGRALWGHGISDVELSRRATRDYAWAEDQFVQAAAHESLRPIEFANRVWFVMRRLSRENGQHSVGQRRIRWRPLYPGGRYRLHPLYSPKMDLLPGCPRRPWLEEIPLPGPRFGHETRDDRGRVRVNLRVGHRFANASGWQWRYRLVASYALGYLPRPDEHVDHESEVVDDDRLENLRLLGVEYHGQLHARAWEEAGRRNGNGQWGPARESPDTVPINRLGPVLSTREIDHRTWRPRSRTLEPPPF